MIRIGKADDNDYVIDDPYVSRYHASLTRDTDGGLLLEDVGSTNGTYVNNNQIVKKHITLADTIRLGSGYVLSVQDALNSTNDYSGEFALLKDVYARYIERKIKIQSSNQFKTRLFQSLPFALPGIIGVTISFLGKGSPMFLGISLFITIIAPTIGVYLGARQSSKIPQQLQELADQFKTDYVCPKCGSFLGEIPWVSLANRKRCPLSSCKAEWMK